MQSRSTLLLFFFLSVGGIAYRNGTATAPAGSRGDERVAALALSNAAPSISDDDRQADSLEPETAQRETSDEKYRRLLPGVWQDEYQGKRTMTLAGDGSGTMVVELAGAKAKLFAPRLHFDMQWSLDGGKLVQRSVGGKPAAKVNLILKLMGDTGEDQILEISDERLRLLDKDGKTEYDWRRVSQE